MLSELWPAAKGSARPGLARGPPSMHHWSERSLGFEKRSRRGDGDGGDCAGGGGGRCRSSFGFVDGIGNRGQLRVVTDRTAGTNRSLRVGEIGSRPFVVSGRPHRPYLSSLPMPAGETRWRRLDVERPSSAPGCCEVEGLVGGGWHRGRTFPYENPPFSLLRVCSQEQSPVARNQDRESQRRKRAHLVW